LTRHAVKEILAALAPKKTKMPGRKVQGFDANTWDRACREIVTCGNLHKFGQNKPLLNFLLGAAGKVWGIGTRQAIRGRPIRANGWARICWGLR